MNVEAIAAIGAQSPVANLAEVQAPILPEAPQAAAGAGFGQMVTEGLSSVNHGLLVSQTDLQQLATGNVQNLHQIMIRLEESRLSFELFLQVRNRLLEAYQDVMKMQV